MTAVERLKKPNSRTNRIAVSILVASLLVRLSVAILANANDPSAFLGGDSVGYENAAKALYRTGHFAYVPEEPQVPNIVRTPGYPAFIAIVYALVGENRVAVIALQVVLSVASAFLVYLIANKVCGSKVALLSLVLFSLDPNSFYLSLLLMSETLFTFIALLALLVGIDLIYKESRLQFHAVALGTLLGLGTLIRPIIYYFPLLVSVGFVFFGLWSKWQPIRLARLIFVFSLPYLILIGSWQMRNYLVAGTTEISSVAGQNLLFYHGANIIARRDGISIEEARQRINDSVRHKEFTPATWNDYSKKVGITLIMQYPLFFVEGQLRGAALLFGSPGVSGFATMIGVQNKSDTEQGDPVLLDLRNLSPSEYVIRWLLGNPMRFGITAYGVFYLMWIYGGLIACGLKKVRGFATSISARWNQHRWPVLFMWGYVVYLLLLSPGIGSESRFRVPMIPVLVLFSAVGILNLSGPKHTEA